MMNFLKPFSLPTLATAMALTFSAAAAQESLTKISVSKNEAGKTAHDMIVASNIAIVIDNSYSIDAQENKEMMEGIKASILDDKMNYSECVAMTVVHFGLSNRIGTTHIFCSKEGAKKFAQDELGYVPDEQPSVTFNVGLGTDIGKGIEGAVRVFEDEKTQGGFQATRRAVFFIGDGPNISSIELKDQIVTLAQQFGATSYAVPIQDNETNPKENQTAATQDYYRANLVTPKGLTYKDPKVFGARMTLPVKPGYYEQASNFTDVRRVFALVLQHDQF